jgi:xylulose-5-phosphate/fructose-6-phosphate phosphoketolase
LAKFFEGQGYEPYFVEGDDPPTVHQDFASASETAILKVLAIQKAAREDGATARPAWPVIILRTPKGWTGPKVVDGLPIEGTFRAHQVPVSEVKSNPEHLRILEEWMRSYRPQDLFDEQGRFRSDYAEFAPHGVRRMGSNPHANGGKLRVPLKLPDIAVYQATFEQRANDRIGSTAILGNGSSTPNGCPGGPISRR